ncbi:MAG: outer membrane lipid asymmetry maintenance protein MlaD [Rhodobacter sp.]|nr:outer membrane lipid asymmetry maintenance protein MlaD [Rhodobacter sp.]
MANQATEVLVGVGVLAVAAGFFIYAAQTIGGGTSGNSDTYTASFATAEGISIGTDVRMSGVKVGIVTALKLNSETFRADATLTVDDEFRLPDDTSALVSSEGLLGGSFIELLPGGSPFDLDPGAEIEDTQSSTSLVQLLLQFAGGGFGDQ